MHACQWTVITPLSIISSLTFFLTEALVLRFFFHSQPSINDLPVTKIINVPLFLFIPQFWCGLPNVKRCVDNLTECNCADQNERYCPSNNSCVLLDSYNASVCRENASCTYGKCSISAIFSGLTFTFMLYSTQAIDWTKFSNQYNEQIMSGVILFYALQKIHIKCSL